MLDKGLPFIINNPFPWNPPFMDEIAGQVARVILKEGLAGTHMLWNISSTSFPCLA